MGTGLTLGTLAAKAGGAAAGTLGSALVSKALSDDSASQSSTGTTSGISSDNTIYAPKAVSDVDATLAAAQKKTSIGTTNIDWRNYLDQLLAG